jgi:hypothetical protein
MRNSSTGAAPWVPLQLYYYSSIRNNTTMHNIRGFRTSSIWTKMTFEHVLICEDLLNSASEIQFRWIGTRQSMWILGNVSARFVVDQTFKIFDDQFDW